MLHVIFTRLCHGHLNVCVGDRSRRSEEIVKNLELRLLNAIIIIIFIIIIIVVVVFVAVIIIIFTIIIIIIIKVKSQFSLAVWELWLT